MFKLAQLTYYNNNKTTKKKKIFFSSFDIAARECRERVVVHVPDGRKVHEPMRQV